MDQLTQLEESGFLILRRCFPPEQIDVWREDLGTTLNRAAADAADAATLRSAAGIICGARNLLSLWPTTATLWRTSALLELLHAVLGPDAGLVRVLYFDKPADGSWALPWHKDLTIAVRDHRLPITRFQRPTFKAGVPHVEAPLELLQNMLTLRLHLDDVTEENGPLKIVPGSHHTGKELRLGEIPPQSVLVERGDVFFMRPLLAHSSGNTHPQSRRHRRTLHFEFAGQSRLQDGYAWHDFVPL